MEPLLISLIYDTPMFRHSLSDETTTIRRQTTTRRWRDNVMTTRRWRDGQRMGRGWIQSKIQGICGQIIQRAVQKQRGISCYVLSTLVLILGTCIMVTHKARVCKLCITIIEWSAQFHRAIRKCKCKLCFSWSAQFHRAIRKCKSCFSYSVKTLFWSKN
jgi:hypothetical protein